TAELPTPSGFVVGAVTTTGQGFEAGAPFTTRLLNVPVNPVTSLDVDLSVAMLGQPANPTIHGNQLWLPRIDGVGRVVKVTADRYVQVCWGEPLCIKVTEWDWRIVAAPDEDLVWM